MVTEMVRWPYYWGEREARFHYTLQKQQWENISNDFTAPVPWTCCIWVGAPPGCSWSPLVPDVSLLAPSHSTNSAVRRSSRGNHRTASVRSVARWTTPKPWRRPGPSAGWGSSAGPRDSGSLCSVGPSGPCWVGWSRERRASGCWSVGWIPETGSVDGWVRSDAVVMLVSGIMCRWFEPKSQCCLF